MKILIWDKGLPLKNAGGPAGYLWNIKQYINSFEDTDVIFYSDLIGNGKRGKNIFTSLLLGLCMILRQSYLSRLIVNYFYKGALSKDENAILNGIDFVHFHTLSAACGYQKLFRKRNVKTILTVHAPEPLIDELNNREGITMSTKRRNKYIKREIAIMEGVDYLMFPVQGALECYTSASCLFEDFFSDMRAQRKVFFVPTALPDIKEKINDGYLKKYNIPKHAKRICYVGRHNKIKGYTYLRKIANKVWEKDPDVYFVIGGKIEGEQPIHDTRWIELGWVNTVNLLQEVDAFVLPNQQTYFDIIALEILRNGTPLVTTLTGGNRYLSEINNGGITFIPKDDEDEASNIIVKYLNNLSVDDKPRLLYEKYFTMGKYIENYKLSISKLN